MFSEVKRHDKHGKCKFALTNLLSRYFFEPHSVAARVVDLLAGEVEVSELLEVVLHLSQLGA